eukprot:3324503-Rhodomonas_salina.5
MPYAMSGTEMRGTEAYWNSLSNVWTEVRSPLSAYARPTPCPVLTDGHLLSPYARSMPGTA